MEPMGTKAPVFGEPRPASLWVQKPLAEVT